MARARDYPFGALPSRNSRETRNSGKPIGYFKVSIRQARNQRRQHTLDRKATPEAGVIDVVGNERKEIYQPVSDHLQPSCKIGEAPLEGSDSGSLERAVNQHGTMIAEALDQSFGKLSFAIPASVREKVNVRRFCIGAIAAVNAELRKHLLVAMMPAI